MKKLKIVVKSNYLRNQRSGIIYNDFKGYEPTFYGKNNIRGFIIAFINMNVMYVLYKNQIDRYRKLTKSNIPYWSKQCTYFY